MKKTKPVSFWKPVAIKPARQTKTNFKLKSIFSPKLIQPVRQTKKSKPMNFFHQFPAKRTKAELKLIDKNPFGDYDKDGVRNIFDCKPFDKKKQMAFKQNDGGRCKAGFRGITGDCFLRAYAITEEKNYKEAYDELNEKFKKMTPLKGKNIGGSGVSDARTGVYKEHAEQILKEKGYEWTPTSGIGKGFQMHVKEGELPKGKNILRVSKHYIASEGDDWKDNHDSSRNQTRGVYGYWKKSIPEETLELVEEPSEQSPSEDVFEDLIEEDNSNEEEQL